MALRVETFQPPSRRELEAKTLTFLKENNAEAYKAMAESGHLGEYCRMKTEAATQYAERLMMTGAWAREAWNCAIRKEILEQYS